MPRSIRAMSALRGRPSSRTCGAGDRVVAGDLELDEVEWAAFLDLERLAHRRRVRLEQPERARDPLQRRPLQERGDEHDEEDGVEDRLALGHVLGEHERPEHDRHGAAEPGPAEEGALPVVEVAEGGRDHDRGGADHEDEEEREHEPGHHHGRQVAREDEQAEDDEHRHLREEGEVLVEVDELAAVARRRAADGEPDEVDGEEAAAPEDVGDPEGKRRRGDRGDRGERARRSARAGRTRAWRRTRARRRRASPIPSCFTIRKTTSSSLKVGSSIQWMRPSVNAIAIGSFRPVSHSSVRARRRRTWVWRSVAKTAAASVDATTPPSRIDCGQSRSKTVCAAAPVRSAVTSDADRAQQRRRHGDVAEAPPRGREAALVEDRDEADDADLARQLGVVELDPAGAVRAEHHPEGEERDERGHAGPRGAEADGDAGGQHRADEQEHGPLVHCAAFSRAASRHGALLR